MMRKRGKDTPPKKFLKNLKVRWVDDIISLKTTAELSLIGRIQCPSILDPLRILQVTLPTTRRGARCFYWVATFVALSFFRTTCSPPTLVIRATCDSSFLPAPSTIKDRFNERKAFFST